MREGDRESIPNTQRGNTANIGNYITSKKAGTATSVQKEFTV
jgi:hypothetical protein